MGEATGGSVSAWTVWTSSRCNVFARGGNAPATASRKSQAAVFPWPQYRQGMSANGHLLRSQRTQPPRALAPTDQAACARACGVVRGGGVWRRDELPSRGEEELPLLVRCWRLEVRCAAALRRPGGSLWRRQGEALPKWHWCMANRGELTSSTWSSGAGGGWNPSSTFCATARLSSAPSPKAQPSWSGGSCQGTSILRYRPARACRLELKVMMPRGCQLLALRGPAEWACSSQRGSATAPTGAYRGPPAWLREMSGPG